MTPEERQELRRWSAEGLFGWELCGIAWYKPNDRTAGIIVKDWAPDLPTSPASQILMVINTMKNLGFNFCLITRQDDAVACCFTKNYNFSGEANFDLGILDAILLAAHSAWIVGKGGGDGI